jgi:CAAX protease family protein
MSPNMVADGRTTARPPEEAVPATPARPAKGFVRRHPVLSFYLLTFAISWGGFLLVGSPGLLSGTDWQTDPLFPVAIMVLLAGPAVAGLTLTGVVSGRAGYRDLLVRLGRWRVGARWYAVALLSAPLLMMATLAILSLFSAEFLPGFVTASERVTPLLLGLVFGPLGALVEELGWTGFATPRLRLRHSVLATGLLMGILWAAWHLLQGSWTASAAAGPVPPALFVTVGFLTSYLLPYRVLMVWVYDRTNSLLLAVLMHASLIVSSISTFGLTPPAITGLPFLTLFLVFTIAEWVVVAVVALLSRDGLRRRPLAGAKAIVRLPDGICEPPSASNGRGRQQWRRANARPGGPLLNGRCNHSAEARSAGR